MKECILYWLVNWYWKMTEMGLITVISFFVFHVVGLLVPIFLSRIGPHSRSSLLELIKSLLFTEHSLCFLFVYLSTVGIDYNTSCSLVFFSELKLLFSIRVKSSFFVFYGRIFFGLIMGKSGVTWLEPWLLNLYLLQVLKKHSLSLLFFWQVMIGNIVLNKRFILP